MPSRVLVESKRDPLFGHTRGELVQEFRESLKGRVQAAYFFGGFAQERMAAEVSIELERARAAETLAANPH